MPVIDEDRLAAWAEGMNCRKLTEAGAFLEGGSDDILITSDIPGCSGSLAQAGDQVSEVPNHSCVVLNQFDRMVFHDGGVVTRVAPKRMRVPALNRPMKNQTSP